MAAVQLLLLIQAISGTVSQDTLWHDDLGALTGLDQSGKVFTTCGVIVFNPCPDPTITIDCCVTLAVGGDVWIDTPVKTTGYENITLHFGMNIDGSTSPQQTCSIYYSIGYDIFSKLIGYTTDKTFFTSVKLPKNVSDNALGIRIMFKMENGPNNNHCYLNSAYLYGTKFTLHPTNSPTTAPTRAPLYPTFNPTSNPTSNPTFIPTVYPTINPTTNPTDNPINNTVPNHHPIGAYQSWINIQYILLCVIMIISIGLIIYLTIYKFASSYSGRHIMRKIRIFAVCQMIGFFLSYLFWMICIIILYNNNDNHSSLHYIIVAIFQYAFWMIGWTLFYILLLFKLYDTFRESHYKMSTKCLYFHVSVIVFIPIWYSIISVSDELDNNKNNSSPTVYFCLCAVGATLILFGMASLMISFNRNLFTLISKKHRNSYGSANMNIQTLDKSQTVLLEVITKQTLLGSIMLFGGVTYLFMIIMLSIFNSKEKTSTEWIIYEWVLAVSVNINLLSVYLGWKMNKKEYKLFCGKCHSVLIVFCKFIAKRNMRRKRKRWRAYDESDRELISSIALNSN